MNGSWFSVAAYLRVCVDDRQRHTLRPLALQRDVQRQEPVLGLGGGCVRVVLQQPTHHTNRRAAPRRPVQRQLAVAVLLGAGLRARRP